MVVVLVARYTRYTPIFNRFPLLSIPPSLPSPALNALYRFSQTRLRQSSYRVFILLPTLVVTCISRCHAQFPCSRASNESRNLYVERKKKRRRRGRGRRKGKKPTFFIGRGRRGRGGEGGDSPTETTGDRFAMSISIFIATARCYVNGGYRFFDGRFSSS